MSKKKENKTQIKENKIIVNLFGEGNCRGDRWIKMEEEEVDLNKVVKFWENRDDVLNNDRGVELNDMEWLILSGSDFVEEEGFVNCLERVEKLLNGESFMVEFEDSVVCIGKKSSVEIEMDFCKGKIELLRFSRI